LQRSYLALLGELAQVEEAHGRPADAIAALERLVAAEPAYEEAHRGLMRLYARTGRRHEALRQYAALRAALRRELDAEPDAASQQLYQAILAGDDQATPSPDLLSAPVARPTGNLPLALTNGGVPHFP
jgi:DNA-binding SARP family transcriptional activator